VAMGFDVKAFGAVGDGETDDADAIQDAIDAAMASRAGRWVWLPAGRYIIEKPLTIGPGFVRLVGAGTGGVGGAASQEVHGTTLYRAGGAHSCIVAAGTGKADHQRARVQIAGIAIDGLSQAATLVDLQRGSLYVNDLTLRYCAGTALKLVEIFNSTINTLRVSNCGSATAPAVLCDAIAVSQGSVDTIHCHDWVFVGNSGTELRLTGNSSVVAPTSGMVFNGMMMEGGVAGTFPFIDLDYSQGCLFNNVRIGPHGGRTGTVIKKNGNPNTPGAPDVFTGLSIDTAEDIDYWIDHGRGSLHIAGCAFVPRGPTPNAFVLIRSTVADRHFVIVGHRNPSPPLTQDERAVREFFTTLYGQATYDPPLLAPASSGSPPATVTVNGVQLGDFVDAVSFSQDLQGTIVQGYVSAANTVTVTFFNPKSTPVDLPSGTLRVAVRR
jgi:hypothetical protein